MRAILITQPGNEEVLQFRQIDEPTCGPDEVLVDVRAAAVNRADLLQRMGRYPAPPGVHPDIPGLELAGEVARVGAAVRAWRPGDRVMAIVAGGAMAQRVAVHERMCLPLPPTMDFAQAAAIPEAFLTAFDALFLQAGLSAGERLWIDAAASGVGTAAVQLGRAAGATVLAGSRSPDKLPRLTELGADAVFDTTAEGWVDRALEASLDVGADVLLDLIGAAAFADHARLVGRDGRWVVIGLMGGRKAELDLTVLMARRVKLTGSMLRSRPLEEKIHLTQRFLDRGMPLIAAGRLRPVVDQVLPWSAVADAHRRLAANATFGKIVLTVDGTP